jgi:hypothetical protein
MPFKRPRRQLFASPAVIAVVALGAVACGRHSAVVVATPEIRTLDGAVTFGDTPPLTLGSKLEAWTKVLGPPSRHVDRAGGIDVWDQRGLALFWCTRFGATDPHVAALWIFFESRDVDFWPRVPYRGRIGYARNNGLEKPARLGPDGASPTIGPDTTTSDLTAYPEVSAFLTVHGSPSRHDRFEYAAFHVDPDGCRLPVE